MRSERPVVAPSGWRVQILLMAALVAAPFIAVAAWNAWTNRWMPADVQSFSVAADGREIHLAIGTCNADHRTSIQESVSSVRVTVLKQRGTTDDCEDIVKVSLDRPLGGRAIVDSSDGDEVRATGS